MRLGISYQDSLLNSRPFGVNADAGSDGICLTLSLPSSEYTLSGLISRPRQHKTVWANGSNRPSSGSLETWVPGKPEKHGGPSPTAERGPARTPSAFRVPAEPCNRYFFFPELPGAGATPLARGELTVGGATGLLPVPFVPLPVASVSPSALPGPVVGPGLVAGGAVTP